MLVLQACKQSITEGSSVEAIFFYILFLFSCNNYSLSPEILLVYFAAFSSAFLQGCSTFNDPPLSYTSCLFLISPSPVLSTFLEAAARLHELAIQPHVYAHATCDEERSIRLKAGGTGCLQV